MAQYINCTFPFEYSVKATSQGEPFTRFDLRNEKFNQYGWRSIRREDFDNPKVLIGNWIERNRDSMLSRLSPLQSQYESYYKTSYQSDFNRNPFGDLKTRRRCPGHLIGAYPNHDAIEDFRARLETFKTTYGNTYCRPRNEQAEPLPELKIISTCWINSDNNNLCEACHNKCIWKCPFEKK